VVDQGKAAAQRGSPGDHGALQAWEKQAIGLTGLKKLLEDIQASDPSFRKSNHFQELSHEVQTMSCYSHQGTEKFAGEGLVRCRVGRLVSSRNRILTIVLVGE